MMIGGVLCLSVGLKAHFSPDVGAGYLPFWLSLGLALYFLGTALFRCGLKVPGASYRLCAAVAGSLLWVSALSPSGLLGAALVIALVALAADAVSGIGR